MVGTLPVQAIASQTISTVSPFGVVRMDDRAGTGASINGCPLCPRKRKSRDAGGTSVMCHYRKSPSIGLMSVMCQQRKWRARQLQQPLGLVCRQSRVCVDPTEACRLPAATSDKREHVLRRSVFILIQSSPTVASTGSGRAAAASRSCTRRGLAQRRNAPSDCRRDGIP